MSKKKYAPPEWLRTATAREGEVYVGWIVVYPTGLSRNAKPNVQFCSVGSNVYATREEAQAHADGERYTIAKVEVVLPALWGNQRQQASEGKVGGTLFRKKPVQIVAYRYRGGPLMQDAPDWVANASEPDEIITNTGFVTKRLKIKTLEGVMSAEEGDWIIRGVKGEVYPCKPDIFMATYEPVE